MSTHRGTNVGKAIDTLRNPAPGIHLVSSGFTEAKARLTLNGERCKHSKDLEGRHYVCQKCVEELLAEVRQILTGLEAGDLNFEEAFSKIKAVVS